MIEHFHTLGDRLRPGASTFDAPRCSCVTTFVTFVTMARVAPVERIVNLATTQIAGLAPEAAERLTEAMKLVEPAGFQGGSSPEVLYLRRGSAPEAQVALPEQVRDILSQVLRALSRGQSISIVTREHEISTQQAAEILGVSRPTVVKLIDDGELSAHVPGTVRRRLLLADVLTYRETLRTHRNTFIAESAAGYLDSDPTEVDSLLAQARREK